MHRITHVVVLATTNLATRQRRDPADENVQPDMNAANDPECLCVVGPVVHKAEDDGEDDTAKVATSASETRDNAVSKGVDVRHQGKVCAIAGFEEDGHQSNKSGEGARVFRVDLANDDKEETSQDSTYVDPAFLQPEVVSTQVI